MNLYLTVTDNEAEIIGQGLHQLPHGQVHALFQKLQLQILAQQQRRHAAAAPMTAPIERANG